MCSSDLATINNRCGNRMTSTLLTRISKCYFKTLIYLNSVSNVRIFAGVVGDAADPASASDPLNAKAGVALWLDSAVSANWKRMHNDTAGASVVDDTSVVAAISTAYPVEIYGIWDGRFRFVFNGVSVDITTDIPASTTALAYWVYIENTTAASRTMRCYYTTVRTEDFPQNV